jgi:hypothetical protein
MRQQLSDQEIRMALNDGKFSSFLIDFIEKKIDLLSEVIPNPKHPRNAELILRFLSLKVVPHFYAGRLKNFLDLSIKLFNDHWVSYEQEILKASNQFEVSLTWLTQTFPPGKVGRRFRDGQWEGRLNIFLIECQAICMSSIPPANIQKINKQVFLQDFVQTCDSEPFLSAITGYMDGTRKYNIRFQCVSDLIEKQVAMTARPMVGKATCTDDPLAKTNEQNQIIPKAVESHEFHANR